MTFLAGDWKWLRSWNVWMVAGLWKRTGTWLTWDEEGWNWGGLKRILTLVKNCGSGGFLPSWLTALGDLWPKRTLLGLSRTRALGRTVRGSSSMLKLNWGWTGTVGRFRGVSCELEETRRSLLGALGGAGLNVRGALLPKICLSGCKCLDLELVRDNGGACVDITSSWLGPFEGILISLNWPLDSENSPLCSKEGGSEGKLRSLKYGLLLVNVFAGHLLEAWAPFCSASPPIFFFFLLFTFTFFLRLPPILPLSNTCSDSVSTLSLFSGTTFLLLTPLDEEEEDHPVKGDHCFDNGFVWQKQFAHTNILIEQKKNCDLE